eukprot:358034-Chlamydomonas_euryale.AAC.2
MSCAGLAQVLSLLKVSLRRGHEGDVRSPPFPFAFTPPSFRSCSGFLTGVGVEVTYADSASGERALRVVTPLPAGPAEAAGVRAGDTIVAIEGQPTEKLSLYEASDLLLGGFGRCG